MRLQQFAAVFAALFITAFAPIAVRAQAAPPKVLEENEVTEKALLDALTPSAEELQDLRTRSLRVGPATGAPGGAAAAGSAGAAGAATATGVGSAATAATTATTPPRRRDVSLLVTFVTNSAALTQRAQQLLDVVGRALRSEQLAGLRFTVEGHADPRGNPQTNLALSQSRAESVRKYLIATHGVEEARLVAVGKGDTQLMNKNTPAAAENRRVTLVTRLE